MRDAIAITGASCRFAQTGSPEVFWRQTLANVPLLSPCPAVHELLAKAEAIGQPWLYPPRRIGMLGGLYSYDPDVFDFPEAAGALLSNDAFFGAQLAVEALRDAGLTTRTLPSDRVGLYIGYANPFSPAMEGTLQHLHQVDQTVALVRNLIPHADETQLEGLGNYLRASLPPLSQTMIQNAYPHTLAAQVSALLGFSGPARIACDGHAAFLAALRSAVDDLRMERVDAAMVGAITPPFTPPSLLAACAIQETSRHDTPHALCRTADGTVPGEGAAFFVLQRVPRQGGFKTTPYALVKAVALSSSVTLPERFPDAMSASLTRTLGAALRVAEAELHAFGYVEVHGSGIAREDNAELDTLCQSFGQESRLAAPIATGTAKPMFGHTLAAAGATGLLRTILALRHRIVPPVIVASKPHLCFTQIHTPLYLPEEPRPWVAGSAPRLAGVTAIDPTGLYAHAILQEFPSS